MEKGIDAKDWIASDSENTICNLTRDESEGFVAEASKIAKLEAVIDEDGPDVVDTIIVTLPEGRAELLEVFKICVAYAVDDVTIVDLQHISLWWS